MSTAATPVTELSWFTDQKETPFFVILESGEQVQLSFAEGAELKESHQMPGATRRGFSVLLHGPKEVYLPQAIYPLKPEASEAREFFMIPRQPTAENSVYEILIN